MYAKRVSTKQRKNVKANKKQKQEEEACEMLSLLLARIESSTFMHIVSISNERTTTTNTNNMDFSNSTIII